MVLRHGRQGDRVAGNFFGRDGYSATTRCLHIPARDLLPETLREYPAATKGTLTHAGVPQRLAEKRIEIMRIEEMLWC